MKYQYFSISGFFSKINTEEKARELVWKYRFGETGFECPECGSKEFYQLYKRIEIRELLQKGVDWPN